MGRVRKFAIGSGVTIGVILLLLAASKRFDIGGKLTSAAGGAGSFFPGLVEAFGSSFAEGAGSLGDEFRKIGENFQRSLGGGLLFSEQEALGGGGFPGGTVTERTVTRQPGQKIPTFLDNALKAFEPDLTQARENVRNRPLPSQVLSLPSVFKSQSTANRERTFIEQNPSGFGSFTEAEAALQKAIAESRQKFPQFFKLPDTGRQ